MYFCVKGVAIDSLCLLHYGKVPTSVYLCFSFHSYSDIYVCREYETGTHKVTINTRNLLQYVLKG